ncbi:MAG: hypothetical protein Q9209_006928 [Squamulea sp. 1 TL-2023]
MPPILPGVVDSPLDYGPPGQPARWTFLAWHVDYLLTATALPDSTEEDNRICGLRNVARGLRLEDHKYYNMPINDFHDALTALVSDAQTADVKRYVQFWQKKPRDDGYRVLIHEHHRTNMERLENRRRWLLSKIKVTAQFGSIPLEAINCILLGKGMGLADFHVAIVVENFWPDFQHKQNPFTPADVAYIYEHEKITGTDSYDAWYLRSDPSLHMRRLKLWEEMNENLAGDPRFARSGY